jgi:hypothetical protein
MRGTGGVVDAGVSCGAGGVVGTTRGAVEVDETGNEGATKGQAV